MFARAYPEYAKTLPEDYDPDAVNQMINWGKAYELLNDPKSKIGKLLLDRNKLDPDAPEREVYDRAIAKEMKQKGIIVEPDGKGGFTIKPEEKQARVPPQVKQAQALVLKCVKGIDPTVAALIASNPKMANSPLVKKAIESVGIPEDLKPAYDKAIIILN